jgi:uncharacterized sulfatase
MALRRAIVVMTDSQRADMLGCYGHPAMKTPCLDRLAAEGLRFERAYCAQPVCGPARSTLFTGQFPHSTGCWANVMPLGETVRTVGQRLQDRGVHTAYIGKWHLDGGDYFGQGVCPPGWDPAWWYDMRTYLEELSPADRLRSRRRTTNQEGIPASFTFGHRCADRAARFLERHGGEEFLLVVSFDEPHDPFLCPEPYASLYRDFEWPKTPDFYDELEDKPSHQQVWAESYGRRPRAQREAERRSYPDYLGCNSFVDFEIGRILDAADRWAPDALVIYTSDHGELLGAHGLWGKGPVAYDPITRIPFLVRGRGWIPAGVVHSHPISHADLTPTLLEYFAVSIPTLIEGRPLQPVLANPSVRLHEAAFIEFGRYETDHDGFGGFQPMRAVFDGRYKLVLNLLTSDELYDLQTDPWECINRINDSALAAVRDRLHDALLDWMNRTRDPFRGYAWRCRPWRAHAAPPSWEDAGMTRQREEDPRYERRQLDYVTGLEMDAAVRVKGKA